MDIEVIVSDNCSSDDTVSSLNAINDNRLFIYQNENNQGSMLNVYNVLKKAKGKYVYFTTDKDFINGANINTFIFFLLQNNNISCGYCEYFPVRNAKDEIFLKGFDAISKVGYIGTHPSGYFFNKDMLESINYDTKFSDKDFIGEFGFDFILAELALKGNAAIFNQELTIPQTKHEAAKDKSLSIKGVDTNAFYTPTSRLNMTINHTSHINQLELSYDDKKKLIIDIFTRGLMNATVGYRFILKNVPICEHYYLEPRNINLLETLLTAWKFYWEYCTKTKLVRKKINFNIITFSFFVIKNLLNNALRKRFNNEK